MRDLYFTNDKATVKNMIVFFLAFLFTQKKKKKLKCVAFSIIAHYCTVYTFKLEELKNVQFLYDKTPV